MDRRSLFRSAAASGLLGIAATGARGATQPGRSAAPLVTGPQGPMPPLPQLTDHGEMRGEMLYRKLGWTGESVSAIGFGGSHFSKPGIAAIHPIDCLHYALNRPTSVVVTGIDNDRVLDQAFQAAKSVRPMSPAEEARITNATVAKAWNGEFELFKTTAHFDGTARNPDWLGPDRDATLALAPKNGG